MSSDAPANLESLVAPWPIASAISPHLPVGDLISLARTNTTLRASLHGFAQPSHISEYETTPSTSDPRKVRSSLNVGFHDTLYWQRLKDLAPFECASRTHTKGTNPRPCRYCSRPICEGCIVRDSMLRGKGDTFKNRCRYLCSTCWDNGNVSKTRRFPLGSSRQHQAWYGQGRTKDEVCSCSLKNDGFICLECKERQNTEAKGAAAKQCHGEGCSNPAGEDRERRRICTWCHKALPRHLGGPSRFEWNQKVIEARQRSALSRQADMEEYNRNRLKLMRMSRREMRGNDAVKDDPEADLPQFLRHLDTFNYRTFMPESAVPSGNEVYLSKKGYWMYSLLFLKHIGKFCGKLPPRPHLSSATRTGALPFARRNIERSKERKKYPAIQREMSKLSGTSVTSLRLDEWHNLKPVILDLLIAQTVPFQQAQFSMFREYDFWGDQVEYEYMLTHWGHSWSKVRFTDEDPGSAVHERAAEPYLEADSDLAFALRLQEEMDRETAEEMQYMMFDDNDAAKTSSADEGQARRPTKQAEEGSAKLPDPPPDDATPSSQPQSADAARNPPNTSHEALTRSATWPLPSDDPPLYDLLREWHTRIDNNDNNNDNHEDAAGKRKQPFMTFDFENNENDMDQNGDSTSLPEDKDGEFDSNGSAHGEHG